jgi:hypothetical protein
MEVSPWKFEKMALKVKLDDKFNILMKLILRKVMVK